MQEIIKIESCMQISESPFILTLNNKFQFIGDEARALEHFCQEGAEARIQFHMSNKDFIVENIRFPEGAQKGNNINIYI